MIRAHSHRNQLQSIRVHDVAIGIGKGIASRWPSQYMWVRTHTIMFYLEAQRHIPMIWVVIRDMLFKSSNHVPIPSDAGQEILALMKVGDPYYRTDSVREWIL